MTPTPDEIPALLAEVARLDKEASEGPWEVDPSQSGTQDGIIQAESIPNSDHIVLPRGSYLERADADFIALSRHGMPALAKEVERLREENEWKEAALQTLKGMYPNSPHIQIIIGAALSTLTSPKEQSQP